MLSNSYPCYTSIPKVCGNCLVANIINDGPTYTIEGKWFEAIMHMTKFEFRNLACRKQVQLLVLILCGKFQLLPIFTLVGF
jgi:hypothetical protein